MCHQTVGLVARHLEANGLPTVIMGCAKDIVEYCGVPRLLFTDFPLGNSAGRIGALTERVHGAPTNRSQRVTMETDVPELLHRCREDGADAVVLVPS